MNTIKIHEVGLRDGLQMEEQVIPSETKIKWGHQLIDAGLDIIQVGSFVHPKYVPQMADTDELFRYFATDAEKPWTDLLSGLVLNEKGLERALDCGVEMICAGVSASETHSQKNTKMGIDEAVDRITKIAKQARDANKVVQLSVQSAFGCGYEGPIAEDQVLKIIGKYLDAGFTYFSLADTAGHADPNQVKRLVEKVLNLDSHIQLTGHFHNTYAMALANCIAAVQAGVEILESSFAGLGGCPFTSVAGGNVCTEDLVHMLQRMGYKIDIDLDLIIATARDAAKVLNKDLPGMIYKSGSIDKQFESK
ncbi:MAG: hydroxymethylglutaryl-CoA lyase [Calditrichaeota bacterium]|nr:MAG: hydroxymethylglutaryl-CoA lyase [Calditrichota bacterium]MBL1204919.1 hydroxymethylglutaryl-CoA lyase [Calditrichota bacterium]NOG44748.1 hydroxymethylglutaryl-CoA lyase [Calditrichota bacterium]